MAEVKVPKVPKREITLAFLLVAAILAPLVRIFFRVKTQGQENLPKGGYILVGNHLSYLDPLAFAYSVFFHMKRAPHYLAKEALFRVPILGSIIRSVGQIPVYRSGRVNDEPMRAAKEFLKAGQIVVIFPEGTLTRDPDLWPMRGKAGAVRLAVELGLPIVPAAHWGVEKVLGPYTKRISPNPFHVVNVKIGRPIRFDKLDAKNLNSAILAEATDQVMTSVAELVGQMRNETPPKELWDPAKQGQSEIGNFRKKK